MRRGPGARCSLSGATPDAEGYIRRDAISDWALGEFRSRYGDESITKEDIFWYVYGILHSPEYKDRFAADLKKMFPRIPFAADFRAFCDAGRELGHWHLNYETVEPFPLDRGKQAPRHGAATIGSTRWLSARRRASWDKSVIVYNPHFTLTRHPARSLRLCGERQVRPSNG